MTIARCLVLGGSGFIGSHLVELLLERQCEVRVFSRSEDSSKRQASIAKRVAWFTGDFQDVKNWADVVQGCDYVFHLIATTNPEVSNRDLSFDVQSNLIPTLRLLEDCVRGKVRRIIFSSSGGTIYGDTNAKPIPETHPTEPRFSYSIMKLAIEKYLDLFWRLHGLDYTVLRIGNCYGPRLPIAGGQGVVGAFLDRLRRGEPIEVWGDGAATRDYVFVSDVVRAFWAARTRQSPFRVFNIGTGVGTSLLELIDGMERVTGFRARIVKNPAHPCHTPVNILDPTRSRQYLGWQASTPLETGLLHTWNWIQELKRG